MSMTNMDDLDFIYDLNFIIAELSDSIYFYRILDRITLESAANQQVQIATRIPFGILHGHDTFSNRLFRERILGHIWKRKWEAAFDRNQKDKR